MAFLFAAVGARAGSDEEAYPNLPACGADDPPALTLHAPDSLPTGYRSGFFLHNGGPGYPDGPYRRSPFGPVIVEGVEGGNLRHAYVDPGTDRREEPYLRWPIQFASGDGEAARIRIRYWETSDKRGDCARELVAIVRHEAMADPKLSVHKGRARGREERRNGSLGRRWRVPVSGKVRRSANRPVVLWLYEGSLARVRKRIKPEAGRFRTALSFWASGLTVGPLSVQAAYPGDVRERWPCDDIFTSGYYDDCRKPLTFPRP